MAGTVKYVEWKPSFFQTTISDVELDGEKHRVWLWDTSAQEYYTDLRPLSYSQSHVLAICYSVDNPNSLTHTEQRWVPEVCHFSPRTPFILVGCKLDRREVMEQTGMEFVSKEQGASMAERIGAKAYVECTSMTGEGITETRKTWEESYQAAMRTILSLNEVDYMDIARFELGINFQYYPVTLSNEYIRMLIVILRVSMKLSTPQSAPLDSHHHMPRPLQRKLVAVGDEGVGKSYLLATFRLGYFSQGQYSSISYLSNLKKIICTDRIYTKEYLRALMGNYVANINVEEKVVQLALWEASGHKYDHLQGFSYSDTHVVLICFSVEDFMTDLRGDNKYELQLTGHGKKCVSRKEGEQMAKRMGASAYLECSAKDEE
ncbi:10704_t:CDS:2, partial [Acaulospora colombiana]